MKFRTVILAIGIIAIAFSLFANEEQTQTNQTQHKGTNSYGPETLDSLTSSGLIKLNRTVITDRLSVNGSLISHGAVIGYIEVIGEANLTDTIIQNGGSILGYLQTHHATVNKPLVLNSQKSVFSASKLSGITILLMDAYKGKQIIELRQKTLVDGPIVFESGKGEVYLYPGSQILGPVSGGKVIKKK